jgi:hypothetical protein
MLVATNNYNSLGRIGPHYERPEYPPPRETDSEKNPAGASERGDRRTLSTRNTDAAPKKAAAPQPTGRLTLDLARRLTAGTCGLIQNLPPQSTTREPHAWLPSSLMTPVYA